jgi:phage terminase small subunit
MVCEEDREYELPGAGVSISNKRRIFIDEYLKDCNATQAAIRAGYSEVGANRTGSRLLSLIDISEEINKRLADKAMAADEVIRRLTEHARGDIGDFLDIGSMSYHINLEKAKELGLTYLIKKVKERTVMTSNKSGEETETHTFEIELYDAQSALALLGKYHGLFVDRTDITTNGESIKGYIGISPDDWDAKE